MAPPSLAVWVSEQELQELPQELTDLGWIRVEDQSLEDVDIERVEGVGFERSMDGWTAQLGWIVVDRPLTAETVVGVLLEDGRPAGC